MPQPKTYPDNVNALLAEFQVYLTVRRDRDQATAESYTHDVSIFIDFFRAEVSSDLTLLTVTPDCVYGFLNYLKKRDLQKSTIIRRLHGLYAFWKFLYRTQKSTTHPPISLDDLDITVKKNRNQTKPFTENTFNKIREEAQRGLANIK